MMHDSSALRPVTGQTPAGRELPPPEVTHVRPDAPVDVRFLIDRGPGRLLGAISVSAIGQAGAVALALLVLSLLPKPTTSAVALLPNTLNYDIVWIPQEGPGGGGGGGGNRSPEPPRKMELPGRDKISLPVTRPVQLNPPKQEEKEPPPLEQLSIPAVAMASGIQTLPGDLQGVAASDSTSQGPGSGGGAGTGRGTGIGPGDGSGLGPGSGGGTGGGVYRPGSGVSTPRILREVKPQYTSEAMRAKIQGEVWLEAVVQPDGTIGHVEIVRSLDSVFGLDQEALKAARQWRFAPGTRMGQPVAVLVTIQMTFTLR